MKLLSALIFVVLTVGVYSNCGCLKCNNEHLHVLKPRGSGIKIIYKNQPCGCLTSVPYSLQVPVQPAVANVQRYYGYQIQEPQVAPAGIACPDRQEYNVQLQVPQSQPAPSYLVGLLAKTDRVLISGPPEPLPSPGCPQAQIESLPTVQETDADWFYANNRPSSGGCGCFRYDRKIPKVSLIKQPHPLLLLLKLQLIHSYTSPKAPCIKRIYRQCFWPRKYQQVFLKTQPKLFWGNTELGKRRESREKKNFDLRSPKNVEFGFFEPKQAQKDFDQKPKASGTIQERPGGSLLGVSKNQEEGEKVWVNSELGKRRESQNCVTPKEEGKEKIHNFDPRSSKNVGLGSLEPKQAQNNLGEKRKTFGTIQERPEGSLLDVSKNQEDGKTVLGSVPKLDTDKTLESVSTKKIRAQNLPRNFHMVKSQQLLLREQKSGPKTIFLSTIQQFSAISASILEKNRPKRSINLKLLALKPENPPRYLRMPNPAQRGFQNHKHEEETCTRRTSLIDRLRGLKNHQNNLRGRNFGPMSHGGYNRRHGYDGQVGIPSWYHGGGVDQGRRNFFGTERLSRFPRENKRKKKVQLLKKKKKFQPKLKKNTIFKSTLKKTSKIIKDWFKKGGALSPPQIQLPNFDSSKTNRKLLPRFKRRIRDPGLLEEKRLGRRKTLKEDKPVQKVPEEDPEEAFLQPLNFDHIFHPTPILHLLNTPIRLLNHYHKLKTHVNPVVGTIPKVIKVSKRYMIDLLKNLGKNAIHLGSHFLKGFTTFKKANLLPKKRLKREWKEEEPRKYHEWVEEEEIPIHIEDWENINEKWEGEELGRFMEGKEVSDQRKKRDLEGFNIFSGLLRLLLGLGKIKADEEIVEPKMKGDYGLDVDQNNDLFESKVVLPPKVVERQKRGVPEDLKRFLNLWKIADSSSRTKSKVELNPKEPQRSSKLSELDVQVQTIKDTISKISSNVKILQNYDVSQNLDVYQGLLKLQHLKSSIVQKWRALGNANEPQVQKRDLQIDLNEALALKSLIFQEILQRITAQNVFKATWIKLLIRLQKLHCVVKKLGENLEDGSKITFLENLELVRCTNLNGIRVSLIQDREVNLQAQIERLEDLKMILAEDKAERIKKEAKVIWEINNIEKLQKVSILELNQKLSQGLKIRKELKILFDLQKQLEACELNLYKK